MFLNYVQDLKIIFKRLPISMFQQCMLYYFDALYVVNQQMYIPSYFYNHVCIVSSFCFWTAI